MQWMSPFTTVRGGDAAFSQITLDIYCFHCRSLKVMLIISVVYVQVLNLLLIILCVIDVIFRVRSKVSAVTPWPAHLLASFLQIVAMV